jgi:hypothetical protein
LNAPLSPEGDFCRISSESSDILLDPVEGEASIAGRKVNFGMERGKERKDVLVVKAKVLLARSLHLSRSKVTESGDTVVDGNENLQRTRRSVRITAKAEKRTAREKETTHDGLAHLDRTLDEPGAVVCEEGSVRKGFFEVKETVKLSKSISTLTEGGGTETNSGDRRTRPSGSLCCKEKEHGFMSARRERRKKRKKRASRKTHRHHATKDQRASRRLRSFQQDG